MNNIANQPSVEEFFESLGQSHPSVISKEKFDKICSVYEMSWGTIPSVIDQELDEVIKMCPVTGEEIRRYATTKPTRITKNVEDITMYEEVEETFT